MMMKVGVFLACLGLALAAGPSAAQSVVSPERDCRCVDRDGNEIERCSCFRAPRLEDFAWSGMFLESRPRLGLSVDVSQSARRDAEGALVTDVLEGGPADEAGLERGDVITSIDGRSLLQPLDGDDEESFDLDRSIPVQRLLLVAQRLEPGQEVEIEYRRDGERRTVTLEAAELSGAWGGNVALPDFGAGLRERLRGLDLRERDWDGPGERRLRFERAPRGDVRIFGRGDEPFLLELMGRGIGGLELVEVNPELGAYFGTEAGVLVADVDDDSSLGLEPGDVVLRIGDRQVSTPDRMRRILRSYGDGEDISMLVRRSGREITVTGRLDG